MRIKTENLQAIQNIKELMIFAEKNNMKTFPYKGTFTLVDRTNKNHHKFIVHKGTEFISFIVTQKV